MTMFLMSELMAEITSLHTKIRRLKAYISNTQYQSLSSSEQHSVQMQLDAMNALLTATEIRYNYVSKRQHQSFGE